MDNPIGQLDDLSLRKAALYLKTSPTTLSGIAKRREIPHSRIGHKFRFKVADLDLYRAEHTVTKVEAAQ